jgi:Activator of Hsp90 ATPase homolog 1-like protein
MSSKVLVALRVPVDPLLAFEVFTREIGSWWQSNGLFAVTAEGDGTLAFEPRAGGLLWTTLANGAQFEIGRIAAWEPGARLVFSWRQASFAPEQATEVEVRFEGVGEETRISVEHRAWDTIPQHHVARHGFPERSTLQHVANWWRVSLNALKTEIGASRGR